jgi:hypothetical protein
MTSIEYLQKEYNENKGFLGSSNFEQAIEMHKQEIIDAYVKGYVEDIPNPIKSEYYIANGEQYYQEKYKQ